MKSLASKVSRLKSRIILALGAWVAWVTFVASADDSAHVVVSTRDLGLGVLSRRVVMLLPVPPYRTSLGTNIFSRDPRRLTNDTAGVCVFSNTLAAYYQLQIVGNPALNQPNVTYTMNLGTNHSGLVSAAALISNPEVPPPNPSTNYYTQAQVDALLAPLAIPENLTNVTIWGDSEFITEPFLSFDEDNASAGGHWTFLNPIFGTFTGDASGSSNAVDLIAGSNITIVTNSPRTFTLSSTSVTPTNTTALVGVLADGGRSLGSNLSTLVLAASLGGAAYSNAGAFLLSATGVSAVAGPLLTSNGGANSWSYNGNLLTNLNATKLEAGLVPTARLGIGSASSSTFLNGAATWTSDFSNGTNANASILFGSGTIPTARLPAFTGGSITGASGGVVLLHTNAVAGGTYRSVTISSDGHVTAGSNPTTFSGYGLSDGSANLAAALTDETGTGGTVFSNAPNLNNPTVSGTMTLGGLTINPANGQYTFSQTFAIYLSSANGVQLRSGASDIVAIGNSTDTPGVGFLNSGNATIATLRAVNSLTALTWPGQSFWTNGLRVLNNVSTTPIKVGGVLKTDTTAVGNIGAGTDTLITYTIPASTLGANGEALEFDCWGYCTNNANTKDITVNYGGTALIDTTALVLNGVSWRAHGRIVRTGAATQTATCEFTVGGTLLSAVNGTITLTTAPAETLSGTVVFKCTGASAISPNDNDIVQNGMTLKWFPTGN